MNNHVKITIKIIFILLLIIFILLWIYMVLNGNMETQDEIQKKIDDALMDKL
jgi:hypothetical protein